MEIKSTAFQQQKRTGVRTERGVALVTALIVTLVVFLLIMSTLYVITTSTSMSGAGKRYATAADAGDGVVELTKELITVIWRDDDRPPAFPTEPCDGETYDVAYAVATLNTKCTQTLTLPGIGTSYTATVTIEYLYAVGQAGSRIEFPPRYVAGMSGVGLYYRIITIVTGPNNTTAENSVLYRFTG
ncbi:MAG: hypothetical protein A2X56_12970 [Nitrospirae bacterium GWC2_57_13]|nr:MAG: hypothetical protein A2X56_12970 [Nitrospirae bacterium GWC2_57_13]